MSLPHSKVILPHTLYPRNVRLHDKISYPSFTKKYREVCNFMKLSSRVVQNRPDDPIFTRSCNIT